MRNDDIQAHDVGFGLTSNYNYEVVQNIYITFTVLFFMCWIEIFKTLLIFEWGRVGILY